MPRTKNVQVELMQVGDQPAEVHRRRSPVMNHSGRKIVATIVSCFITSFWRLLTVERYRSVAPEQVAVGVDQVADADQMVIDVAEVVALVELQPGQLGELVDRAREQVALRGDHLAHRHERGASARTAAAAARRSARRGRRPRARRSRRPSRQQRERSCRSARRRRGRAGTARCAGDALQRQRCSSSTRQRARGGG